MPAIDPTSEAGRWLSRAGIAFYAGLRYNGEVMTEQTQALMEDQHRPAAAQDTPRLTGAWLRVARVSWLVLALVALAILLASLPGYALPLSEQLELSTGEPPPRTALESQGPGVVVLSTLSRLASLATALLSLALAALLFRRRFQEPAAAALSFYLLAYGVVMAGPLEFAAGYWRGDVALATTLQGALLGVPTVALFALFPNGRFVPAWTRWLLLLSVLWSVSLFFLPSMAPASIRQQSPWMIGFLALWAIGLFGAALSAQVYRYRRVSSRDERQQTKWVVYGFALWLGYMIFSSIPYYALSNLPAGSAIPLWGAVSALTWFLALSIVPASLAIAVTRHRLWDIDLVINRTLVYGALTACVVGIYALVVGGLGALFNAQGNWLITLVATGLVAVLFQPLRERLQRGVNRLLYGRRDEPFEVLERLGQRVEDTFDPEGVLPTMVETVAQTLKLPYVAIAVGQGDDLRTIESYGKPGASPHAFLLTYQGTAIGQLLAAQRAPNEAFTETEERLLRELARQAGTAVHAQQLTADVRRARQEVVASR